MSATGTRAFDCALARPSYSIVLDAQYYFVRSKFVQAYSNFARLMRGIGILESVRPALYLRTASMFALAVRPAGLTSRLAQCRCRRSALFATRLRRRKGGSRRPALMRRLCPSQARTKLSFSLPTESAP